MFSYSDFLANLRSLLRTPLLLSLMVGAIGVGIGGWMTLFAVYHALESDPIPTKSGKLFAPRIDIRGPAFRPAPGVINRYLTMLTYRDTQALIAGHRQIRQTATYATRFSVVSPTSAVRPFHASGRAAYPDFFEMFDVPFHAGAPWTMADEQQRSHVVVITGKLAGRLFGQDEAIGQTLRINDEAYRVVGVMDAWQLRVPIYDLNGTINDVEDVFLPFNTAIDRRMAPTRNQSCFNPGGFDPNADRMTMLLNSECVFINFWIELPEQRLVAQYEDWLNHYAQEQQANGRFGWLPLTKLQNATQYMAYVEGSLGVLGATTVLSLGFFVACLVNAIGLMLARLNTRATEFSIRRLLGAKVRDIFALCLAESAAVGALGSLCGLAVSLLGLALMRAISPPQLARLEHIDLTTIALAILISIVATVCVGVIPAWRASGFNPVVELKH
jgi:putative ABC transport system permease protein